MPSLSYETSCVYTQVSPLLMIIAGLLISSLLWNLSIASPKVGHIDASSWVYLKIGE